MCEALVRIVSKGGPDLHEAGDVIVVCPDGWGWSEAERTNPEWRIVKLPGVEVEALDQFTLGTYDMDRKVIRRRGRHLNVNHPALAPILASGQVVTLSPDVFDAAALTKD